jgi:CheY-like chemotaxis protein
MPDAQSRQRVLVVDDNEDAATMLGAALTSLGHVVDVTFDGPSALAHAETFRPTAVLLDIGLPGMNGYDVARTLRSHNGTAPVRLIAVTGYGQLADRERALEAGFEHHLVKPVSIGELERILGDGRGG